jgi:hypothetical protein
VKDFLIGLASGLLIAAGAAVVLFMPDPRAGAHWLAAIVLFALGLVTLFSGRRP